jgi:hypothetical protein
MRKLPRRYFLIPTIYIAFVVALLALAVFGRRFAFDVDSVRISGSYTAWPPFSSRTIRSLSLSYRGLKLSFSRAAPLSTDQGTERLLSVASYSGGADIIFEGDYRLRLLTIAGGEDSFGLSFVAPEGHGKDLSLAIPFSPPASRRGELAGARDSVDTGRPQIRACSSDTLARRCGGAHNPACLRGRGAGQAIGAHGKLFG